VAIRPLSATEGLACLADPAAIDRLLLEYVRRSDRTAWCPYDFFSGDDLRLAAQALSDTELAALKTILFVEDHLPAYVAEHLRFFGDPSASDAQQTTDRKMLRFTFRWAAEEDRHSHVLEMYLLHCGRVTREELEADMLRERRKSYRFPYRGAVETYVYLALQERAAHLYYTALARDLREPLLCAILRRMAADEASHAAFFYDLLLHPRNDLDALAAVVGAVAREFKMPVQRNLLKYRAQIAALMRSAPSYHHRDVFAHMLRALEKSARTRGREALSLLAPGVSST
jgi:acyl-[acyl-carrier-protein] desaturase